MTKGDEENEDEEPKSVHFNSSAENQDDHESGGGGSVQLNEVDHTESWINDEFDAKEMPLTDDHDDADNENEDEKQTESIDSNQRRHRGQISELERPFTVNESVRKNSIPKIHIPSPPIDSPTTPNSSGINGYSVATSGTSSSQSLNVRCIYYCTCCSTF